MGEARGRDLVAVAPPHAAAQRAAHGLLTGRDLSQVGKDPAGVQDRGGLHDPGDDQVPEHLITQDPEPQVVVDTGQGVEQRPRAGRHDPGRRHPRCSLTRPAGFAEQRLPDLRCRDQVDLARCRLHPEIELTLGVIGQQRPSPLQQQPELGLGARGP